jgi:hypothetical protein
MVRTESHAYTVLRASSRGLLLLVDAEIARAAGRKSFMVSLPSSSDRGAGSSSIKPTEHRE